MLTITGFFIISLAIGFGAALQGSVGYGMALLASPILVLVDSRFVPGPFLLAAQVLSILVVLRERQAIDLGGVKWAIVGRIPGSIIAGMLLLAITETAITLTFGILILFAVALSLAGLRFPPKKSNLVLAGMLSAVMGTIATVGGPPMAIVYQDVSSPRLRSTLSGYFFIGTLFSLTTLFIIGRFGSYEFILSLTLIPGILIGYLASSHILPLLNEKHTRHAVLAIAAISGILVIVRQII